MKRRAPKLSLSRFQPLTAMATAKINELIAAGAKLTLVEHTRVQLQRMESVAIVDEWGGCRGLRRRVLDRSRGAQYGELEWFACFIHAAATEIAASNNRFREPN